MKDRTRQQRARDAAAGLRKFSPEEERRVMMVMVPYTLVSLVLQGLLVVVGICTARTMVAARHLRARPLLNLAARGPLLSLVALNLAQIVVGRRVSAWFKRLNANPPD